MATVGAKLEDGKPARGADEETAAEFRREEDDEDDEDKEEKPAFFPLLPFAFSPFAAPAPFAFSTLPRSVLRCIGFALTDDFDERGVIG
jgi:hypothetical protein